MKRTGASRHHYFVKPIVKANLSEKNIPMRIAAVILLLIITGAAFSYALISYLSVDAGWVTIEAEASSDLNCGNEFVFLYNIGASGASAAMEKKVLISLYSEATKKAYELFHKDALFEGVNNIAYINQHPNEVIEVDEVLYKAFSLLNSSGNRNLYLAPIDTVYGSMFACENDTQIVDYDPYQNDELRSFFAEIAAYVQRSDMINLELLGNYKIKLKVSNEYQEFADDNGITEYIDFFWMKNAFIIDYLAEVMKDKNYTFGSISSYNGFVRNLDETNTSYSYQMYDRVNQTIYPAGVLQYNGPKSIVYLRNYRMTQLDHQYYYERSNGEIRTAFLDPTSGLCKSSINDLLCFSKTSDCAEILLKMIPIYITDTFHEDELTSLKKDNIYSVYCNDKVIHYNDSAVSFTNLFEKDTVRYKANMP